MGLKLFNALAGNLNEMPVESLQKEYGAFLMDGEQISCGFQLIRDVVIFTDRRIIDIDKQGTTGQKRRVKSIYLASIFAVECETAGFGIDDSSLTISYVVTPYMRCHALELDTRTFEFPKKYNIRELYTALQTTAFENFKRLNQ